MSSGMQEASLWEDNKKAGNVLQEEREQRMSGKQIHVMIRRDA